MSRAISQFGLTPYQWVTAPVPYGARTLDLACGSGPCLRLRPGEPWVGVDQSQDELARARREGTLNILEANAVALPFEDAIFDAVVCSMALMLLEPLGLALDEVGRVLRPGGLFIVTVPGRRPLGVRDVLRYARLVRRLGRRRLTYPNGQVMSRKADLIESSGFHLVEDIRRRFAFPVESALDGVHFVRSLYLPDTDASSTRRSEELAARWVGREIGIPLRRLTLVRV